MAKINNSNEEKQAIESFFNRGWGFVHYNENGLHFLEADFEAGLISVKKDQIDDQTL